ncbi:MAG: EutN/CcmL family microcompartment protein [Candidatus Ruminococcus intestinipullorum]|nr:EutN/CcmL family microcompartment protein [Candidatus Ruminococcus intestinipullorum]
MLVGKVVGSVISTRKSENLIGSKFMIVDVLDQMQTVGKQLVAIDKIGAGIGEYVLVAQGSAARIGCDMENAPIDAAIVGIIDDGTGLE